MAATYVMISRRQLEDWLFDLCPVFERVPNREGVYLVPLSSTVAVKVSTTLGQTNVTTSRGEGRCRMVFVCRHGGRVIHGPERDTLVGNRTQGWAENWSTNLRSMFALFKEHRDAYTEQSLLTQPEYAATWVGKIETVKNYRDFDILVDLRRKLQEGAWLSPRQEAAVTKFVTPKRKGAPKKPRAASKGAPKKKFKKQPMTAEQRRLLVAAERLESAAKKKGDDWLIDFCFSIVARLKGGRDLTKRQRETFDEKIQTFGISVPSAA